MRTVTVYRVDYVKKTRGSDRRDPGAEKEGPGRQPPRPAQARAKNLRDRPEDAIHIAVDNREARRAWMLPNAVIHNSGEEYSSAD